ncbi:succinate dehydrogenase, hydrophobic membrane anchor protein, partial [candidate division CSSED10-310 bacterium]
FELFQKHEDAQLMRWALSLCSTFIIFMALLMLIGTQTVSLFLFWTIILILVVILFRIVWLKVWPTYNKMLWKVQRLTGVMLLPLALGHYMIMHLNETLGHHADTILARLKNPFIILIDLLLLATVTTHAWYGIQTLINDNVSTKSIQFASRVLLTFIVFVIYIAGLYILTFSL